MLVMAEGGCRLSHLGAGRKGEALFRLCSLGGDGAGVPGVWWEQQLGEETSPPRMCGGVNRGDARRLFWWLRSLATLKKPLESTPSPVPLLTPHHKTPEPKQSQQVYCQQQHRKALPGGPSQWLEGSR